jgi:hypothetical protein
MKPGLDPMGRESSCMKVQWIFISIGEFIIYFPFQKEA